MSKLITLLLAGLVSAGAFAQTTSGSASGSTSTSNNTNTNTATSANANTNLNTNTNTQDVNVFGPGSNKLARTLPSTGTNVSMMPGHHASGTKPTTTAGVDTRVMGAGKACPHGLAKKHNHCMPPGIAKRER